MSNRTRLARLVLLLCTTPVVAWGADIDIYEPDEDRRPILIHLVRQDCGSCHGLTLKGGLGPALTPSALVGKPADYLAYTILNGRSGTAMPGWRAFIDENEAQWIVRHLLTGFPLQEGPLP